MARMHDRSLGERLARGRGNRTEGRIPVLEFTSYLQDYAVGQTTQREMAQTLNLKGRGKRGLRAILDRVDNATSAMDFIAELQGVLLLRERRKKYQDRRKLDRRLGLRLN